MDSLLREALWHDFEAVMLENDGLRVIVVPDTGARIVSLFDKVAGREWLLSPRESHPCRRLEYGVDFNTTTPGGWDEMFPTILAEPYPGPGLFRGVPLPDHGEVWAVPWTLHPGDGETLRTSVDGRALPYRLVRGLALGGPRAMTVRYALANLGADPLHYLWAAHPQFACDPGATIVLPDEVREVVNVMPPPWGAEWGVPGARHEWPRMVGASGQTHAVDTVGSPALQRGRKFYILPDAPISRAGLHDPVARCSLWLEWDAAAAPYCGVWIDEGMLNARPSVAIEPTTGYYDTLNTAWNNRRLAVVEPGAVATWELTVRMTSD
jgi:galactose mutarotase-like enzyme